LDPGQSGQKTIVLKTTVLEGQPWIVRREASTTSTKMHWTTPGSLDAHKTILSVLASAGFDEVLCTLGENLKLNHLTVLGVYFLAVSDSGRKGDDFFHADVQDTNMSAYNILFPLMLVEGSQPELIIQDQQEDSRGKTKSGNFKFREHEALILGEGAIHSTNPGIKSGKAFRLMASIYVADVDKDNIKGVLKTFDGSPSEWFKKKALLQMGIQWSRADPRCSLSNPCELKI
jgi:hypothetical protein